MAFPNCVPNFPGFRALYDALVAMISVALAAPEDKVSADFAAVAGHQYIVTESAVDQTATLPAAPANGDTIYFYSIVNGGGADFIIDGGAIQIVSTGTGVSTLTKTIPYGWSLSQVIYSSQLGVWLWNNA